MNREQLDRLIDDYQRSGDSAALVEALRGAPMGPSGFERHEHGLAFGDGEMSDDRWLAVDTAAMEGRLSEKRYGALYDAVFGAAGSSAS